MYKVIATEKGKSVELLQTEHEAVAETNIAFFKQIYEEVHFEVAK